MAGRRRVRPTRPAADPRRSLEELEDDRWGDPPPDSTGLVRTVHRLRRTPIGELSTSDLCTLIGQRIAPYRLVPPALDRLRGEPLAEDGYLLAAVLRVKAVLGAQPRARRAGPVDPGPPH